ESSLDDLLNSTGYSKAEKAETNTDRADAAYNNIQDYRDKNNLNEAKRLYQEAANNNPESEYIKGQLAKVEKILNYKPLKGGVIWAEKNLGGDDALWTHEEAVKNCPEGWRLPTKEEFIALWETESKETEKGRTFYNDELFFPAAGYYHWAKGFGWEYHARVSDVGKIGVYWISTECDNNITANSGNFFWLRFHWNRNDTKHYGFDCVFVNVENVFKFSVRYVMK
ncbi:MAG: fibrobacter succinogenes major paralogous domain-containing protein, partial [Prevotellaceae bacterium]|nr:fibrobacter succinogenes major paralogous domain-containing protein [Prevotellaceae bacterium]